MKGSVSRDNGWRVVMWAGAALLLLVPMVAMHFSSEVAWDAADFATFGLMLLMACGTYELTVRLTKCPARRGLVAIAIAAVFFLVWLEFAVGILPG